MKTAIIIGIILIIILIIYFVRKNTSTTEGITNIAAEEAKQLIEKNQGNKDFVILDVRTLGEYSSGHISGAVNIDYYKEGFKESIDTLNRDKTYLIYCRSGNRSAHAAGIMKQMDFNKLFNLKGGIIMYKP